MKQPINDIFDLTPEQEDLWGEWLDNTTEAGGSLREDEDTTENLIIFVREYNSELYEEQRKKEKNDN